MMADADLPTSIHVTAYRLGGDYCATATVPLDAGEGRAIHVTARVPVAEARQFARAYGLDLNGLTHTGGESYDAGAWIASVSGTADRAIATAIHTATARLDLRAIRPAVQSHLAGHGLPLPSDEAIRAAYALVAAARAGVPAEGEALRWLASPPRARYSPTLRRTLGLARALVSAVQRFVPTHRVTINRTIRR